jgi:nucleotide-binding universal stress UspA family protein
MASIHQLLVPVDGSLTSAKAVDTAIELARLNGARVRLFHVIDELDHVNGFETSKTYNEELVPLMRAGGEKLLAQMRRRVTDQGLVCDSVLVESGTGRVCEQVAEEARLVRADMIVLGSHGRHGLARMLMGSDAEQIARHAPVPVLVVKG